MDIHFIRYNRIAFHVGHCNFKLPHDLSNKKAVINVGNTDNKCFLYAVLSVLKKGIVDQKQSNRPAQYVCFFNELDFSGINFPFQVVDLPRFHRQNKSIGINLLKWDNSLNITKVLVPAPLDPSRNVISILLVEQGKNYHYVGVSNLDRLLNSHKEHNNHKRFYCTRCLRPFFAASKLEDHIPLCLLNKIQCVSMPKHKSFKFTNYSACVSPAYVIYADLESLLVKDVTGLSANVSHKPIAIAYNILPNMNLKNNPIKEYREFVGMSCIENFLRSLERDAINIYEWMEKNTREIMKELTHQEEYLYSTLVTVTFVKKC